MNMIISLQDNQGGTAVQIKATHDQIPAMLREIAGRIIDWRTESLTIRPVPVPVTDLEKITVAAQSI